MIFFFGTLKYIQSFMRFFWASDLRGCHAQKLLKTDTYSDQVFRHKILLRMFYIYSETMKAFYSYHVFATT